MNVKPKAQIVDKKLDTPKDPLNVLSNNKPKLLSDEDEDLFNKKPTQPQKPPVADVKPIITKPNLIADEDNDLFSKKPAQTPQQANTIKLKLPLDNDDDDLFSEKSTTNLPKLKPKLLSDDENDLFSEKPPKAIKPVNESNKLPQANDLLSNKSIQQPQSETIKPISKLPQTKSKILSSDDDDDLFKGAASLKKNSNDMPFIQPPPLVDSASSSDEDISLFKPKNPSPIFQKPVLNEPLGFDSLPDIGQPVTNQDDGLNIKPSAIEQEEPPKKPKLFNKNQKSDNLFAELNKKLNKSEEKKGEIVDDPLGAAKITTEDKKPEAKLQKLNNEEENDLFKPKVSIKAVLENESNESVSSIKALQKNLSLNPSNLLPGSKPPQSLNKSLQKVDENVEIGRKNTLTSTTETKTSDDTFNLDVDRTFNDQSIRNAQKDRIKVAQKKRPPSVRAARVEVPVDEKKQDKINFGFDDDDTDLFSKKPTQQSSESIKSKPLLDENEDIFGEKSPIKASSLPKPKSDDNKETPAVIKEVKNVLQSDDDDLDLLKPLEDLKETPKKEDADLKSVVNEPQLKLVAETITNKKKKSNIVFEDDTDLFADVSLLSSNKPSKKEKEKPSSISTNTNKPKKFFAGKTIFNI